LAAAWRRRGRRPRSAPSSTPSARRSADGSTPSTRQPAARSSWDGDEPDEAEADDDHPLAERRLGAAHALQSDGAHGGEGRVAQRHALGHGSDEVAGHRHDLGVVGAAGARAGDVLADAELGDPAGVEHDARARVAQDGVVGDRVAHRLDRVAHAVLAGVLERQQHEVGVADRAHRQRAAAARREHLTGGAHTVPEPLETERDARRLWSDDDTLPFIGVR
jgi:hypothetical protein